MSRCNEYRMNIWFMRRKSAVDFRPIRFSLEGGTNLLIIRARADPQCAAAARVTKMVLIKE